MSDQSEIAERNQVKLKDRVNHRSISDKSDSHEIDIEDDAHFESISITNPVASSESGSVDVPNTAALEYRATDCPRWNAALLLGFQQTMVCISGILVIPHLVAEVACAGAATIALRVQLISTTLVVTGITTLIQTTFGLRLAILQGPSFAFVPPLYAFNDLPEMKCKATMHDEVPEEYYYNRIQTIQGSLTAAAVLLTLFGATGLIGIISRRIGPLTICPLMILLCVGNGPLVIEKSELHWISIIQFGVLLLFALFLTDTEIPLPYVNRTGIHFIRYRLFGQFPYLISIILTWLLALFLTQTNLEPKGGYARVDNNQSIAVLKGSPWLQAPYPGQFGIPQFSLGLFLGMCASCVACSVESLGAYGTLARVSQEKPPPSSTLNRAIVVEGAGCFLAGLMGCGVGITTYSENVAVVSITKVASRYTMQIAGIMLVFLGVFTKFGAILATIPDPIVGGTLGMGVCMIAGVSLSNLQSVDLKKSRNLTIMGIAIILGIIVPDYFHRNPVATGIREIDQMLNILLQIKMFVGGIIAFVLDNIAGGATPEQRGLNEHSVDNNGDCANRYEDCGTPTDGYAFPSRVNGFLLRTSFMNRLPFMPSKPRLQASCASLDKNDEAPLPNKKPVV
ncbi:Solute carrier family 23 member 2 [Aphelenchoides besseyi]|nr:Solute carrier family 23 member 2 [Aphelenchoides besseyi]KAI6229630.1 Solute carrier family 23 member 2 [Aphelenchoides besseyi]